MTRDQFIKSRRDAWRRFQTLVHQAGQQRITKLSGDEISELSALYRSICFDLSLVQSRDWGTGMGRYLNGLVAEGHNCLYRSRPSSFRNALHFAAVEFPQRLRANWPYFWLAFLLFVVPGAVCGTVAAIDPSQAGRIMSASQQDMFEEMYSESISERKSGMQGVMAGFYVRNNVGIAFRCFALGIFAGIGTMVVLVSNSIFLGTVTGLLIARGHGGNFLEFVVGHGAFELTAIVVAGAAGLMIGHAVVHPGTRSRWNALRVIGLDAVKLALGAGGMLCVAAIVEAYWSPSAIPYAMKIAAGACLWVIVACYLLFAGRVTASKRTPAVEQTVLGKGWEAMVKTAR